MHFSAHPGIVRELARPCKCECPRLIQELHGLNAAQQLVWKIMSISLAGANGSNGWGRIDPNNYMTYMTFIIVYLREISSANPPAGYMSEAALKPESLCQRWIARQSSNFVLSNNWTSKRRGFGTCLVPIFGLNMSSHGFQILFSELSTTSGTHTSIHELGQAINQGVGLCFALSHGYLQKFLLLPGSLS